MNLQNAIFNWLQISLVSDARPEDRAARETKEFFETILQEDHAVLEFSYTCDEEICRVDYTLEGQALDVTYEREIAEQLLTDINSNPKYNE